MSTREKSIATPLLQVHDLAVSYRSGGERRMALDGASLELYPGERYGLVGESGSGKTTLALTVLGLIEAPGWVEGGQVLFDGRPLLGLPEPQLDELRGGQIGLIFQNAPSSLNPTFTIGAQLVEMLQVHRGLSRALASGQAGEWLERVELPGLAGSYPHQLSVGQAQRAAIALALAPGPRLLIADEPTSALDMTTQARIMRLLRELTGPDGAALLLITHDPGLLAQNVERVGVLHAGRTVEQQAVEALFANPQHPYTRQLIAWLPQVDLQRG